MAAICLGLNMFNPYSMPVITTEEPDWRLLAYPASIKHILVINIWRLLFQFIAYLGKAK